MGPEYRARLGDRDTHQSLGRETVKISIRRAAAATAVAALAATGATTLAPTANAQQQAASATTPVLTPFGYNTVASGIKLMTQGVDVRNVRQALVTQACTRMANTDTKVAKSDVATPDNPLINVSATTSTSKTYKIGTKYGAIATNTIGDIAIGNADYGTITIKGLSTAADAWHTPNGYFAKPSLDLAKISITLPAGTEVPAPLQDLLDAIDTQVMDNVIDVLQTATAPIKIPGFGKIAIGEKWRQKGAHFASSDAHGLVIQFTGDGSNTVIYLGQAHSRIGGTAPKQVFRSNIQAMDVQVLDSLVHLSRVGATNLPCEGTYGATRHKQVSVAGIVSPVLVKLSGIDNSYAGTQGKDGASGWVQSRIGQADIPLAQLTLKGIVSRVKVTKVAGKPITSAVKTSLAELILNGESVAVPGPGEVLELPNGIGTVETNVIKKGKLGAKAQAVRITLFEQNVVILLGWADNNLWNK